MSKKILVISGSPRKGGNSDILCDEFIRGSQERGNTAEKIYLKDKKIGFCSACYGCRETHECVQKDDMTEILEKMAFADVVVLATPVYFYMMDAQMKVMIDRTLPRYTQIRNKDFYFIATAADSGDSIQRTMDGLCGYTDCLPGAKVKKMIYGEGAWQIGDINSKPTMQEAYEAGLKV
jgi:multimeric flavodoxin WrbA